MAWAIAVALGIVIQNDLPSVRIITNCSYAIKIFDGSNKASKYHDIWSYVLTDLYPKAKKGPFYKSLTVSHGSPGADLEREMRQGLSAGLFDPTTPILTSISSCKAFLATLELLSPTILRALVDQPEECVGVFSPEATVDSHWQAKHMGSTSHVTCSQLEEDASVSMDYPMDTRSPTRTKPLPADLPSGIPHPVTEPQHILTYSQFTPTEPPTIPPSSQSTQDSLHLHLDSTLPPPPPRQVQTLLSRRTQILFIYLFIYCHLYSAFSIIQCSNALYRL